MIGWLEGVLREKTPTRVLVDVGGVGYEAWIPLSTFTALPDEGKTVALHIHTHVRADAILLFGFRTARERAGFELLLQASRVGPKLALTVLSGIDVNPLLAAIRGGDVALLQSVPGIGRRMAERIVVELRDRVDPPGEARLAPAGTPRAGGSQAAEPAEQVLSALTNLEVPRPRAERALREALAELGPEEPIESLIRAALRRLSR